MKRQSNGKHNLEKKVICVLRSQELYKFTREEIVVLEKKQNANVNDQAEGQKLFFSTRIIFLVNVFSRNEVSANCSKQNNDIVWNKEHVKKTTREQKPCISELFGQKEIGQRNYWKENEKVKRAEQHCANLR